MFSSINKKILFVGLLFVSTQANTTDNTEIEGCWLESYGRGVGKPITVCPEGLEQSGLLCYPKCAGGYTGVGPVCWQNCPEGFKNTGAHCLKPSSYGRGSGYVAWHETECNNDNSQGCEKYGAMWYPKCAKNFHNVGCCVCSPDCPNDMTDIGVSCQKKSYGRGAGVPLVCKPEQDQDAGLCYDHCGAGWKGIGPVCWGSCPEGMHECGALCLSEQKSCAGEILKMVGNVAKGVAKVAGQLENPVGAIIDATKTGIELAGDLAKYSMCSNMAAKSTEAVANNSETSNEEL